MSGSTQLRFAHALLDGKICADVLLEIAPDGVITSVGAAPPGDRTSVQPGLALPGIANLHSHAFQRLMAGLAEFRTHETDSFWSWRELMYEIAGKLAPDEVEAVAAHLYAQLLENGFTGVAEFHYLHHDVGGVRYADPAEMSRRLIGAARAVGMPITLLPVLYQRGGFDGRSLGDHQQRFGHETEEFLELLSALENERDGQVEIGLAIHSLRAVALDQLQRVVAEAPAGRPRHIHIAEQPLEVDDCLAAHGARPVALLADNIELSSRWTLVHATHVDEGEVRTMARSGAVVGLCPTTEANLGDGLFPVATFLGAGGRMGVGTDSHVAVDPAVELRWLEYGQRLISGRRCVALPAGGRDLPTFLWEHAAVHGATACGRNTGKIAVGHRADIVTIASDEDDHPDRLLGRHLFGEGFTRIDGVWIGGSQKVKGGRHPQRDRLRERFGQVLARVLG